MEPENIIKSIPEEDKDDDKHCGRVKIRFMRLTPSFKIIDKEIPMSLFFDSLANIKRESKDNGILVSINENNLKIKDYYSFVKTMLKNQKLEVFDEQRNYDKGNPDFRIVCFDNSEFHIEFKSKNDSIRPAQLQWIGNNPNKEAWFLILEEIDTLIESDEIRYRQFTIDANRRELVDAISKDVCDNIENKLKTDNQNGI